MFTAILGFVFWLAMVGAVVFQAQTQNRKIAFWVVCALIVTPVIPASVLYFLGRRK